MLERHEPADDRLLPDRQADAVAELQRERRFLVREAEVLRPGPHRRDLRGRAAGTNQLDRRVEIVAAPLVRVDERVRREVDREAAVVARAVTHVRVQDVVIHGIAWTQHAIREDVRMRTAPLAGNRVHAFDVLGSEVVQDLAHEPDRFVLAHARLHRHVQLVVRGVDHHRRVREQRDLVLGLDLAGIGQELLTVDDGHSLLLQREQNRRLDDVDADRFLQKAARFELDAEFLRDVLGASHLGRHRSAQQRDAGARPLAEPRAIELMVLRRRPEIPEDRLAVLRQQREPADLVLRPRADVGGGDVADVVHVEADERAQLRLRQQLFDARKALAAQAIEIDPPLPVDAHRAVGANRHKVSLILFRVLGVRGFRGSHEAHLPHSRFAASKTVFSVGIVASSSGGENGIGTCIAATRVTGASRL